jgi:hypothetical protein
MGYDRNVLYSTTLDTEGELMITAYSGEPSDHATIMKAQHVIIQNAHLVFVPATSISFTGAELRKLRDVLNNWFPPQR